MNNIAGVKEEIVFLKLKDSTSIASFNLGKFKTAMQDFKNLIEDVKSYNLKIKKFKNNRKNRHRKRVVFG